MCACVDTLAPSRMHLFYTLEMHLGDQRRVARDWLVADMSSEKRSGCQGQQCEPLGYVLAWARVVLTSAHASLQTAVNDVKNFATFEAVSSPACLYF